LDLNRSHGKLMVVYFRVLHTGEFPPKPPADQFFVQQPRLVRGCTEADANGEV
jgi:hypothetical protein